MLLNKVESALDLDVNVITRKIEKDKLCELDYKVLISPIHLGERKELVDNKEKVYHYLLSHTGVYIDRYLFTTTSSIKLYGNPVLTKDNPGLWVRCESKKVKIGYKNIINYLHLPDYVMAQVLHCGGKVTVVEPGHILELEDFKITIFEHKVSITSPYYIFNSSFDYYENANILAEIIGAFDVYKRGLIKHGSIINTDEALKYFLYPYVSLILYKKTKTTLYPSLIRPIVSEIIDKVKDDALKVLEKYTNNTLSILQRVIDMFNRSEYTILEVY
jgi:hypothetical protein